MVKVRIDDNGPPKDGQFTGNVTQKVKLNIAGAPPHVQNQMFDSESHYDKVLKKWEKEAAEFKDTYHAPIASGGQGACLPTGNPTCIADSTPGLHMAGPAVQHVDSTGMPT